MSKINGICNDSGDSFLCERVMIGEFVLHNILPRAHGDVVG